MFFPSRPLRYSSIVPGSLTYNTIFHTARLLSKCGIIRHSINFQVIIKDEFILILTPLAGSSAILNEIDHVLVKNHEQLESIREDRSVFVLARKDSERYLSFYNKKIRNPTNIAKCVLLAQCGNLSYSTTFSDFELYIHKIGIKKKDKHLYSSLELLEFLNLKIDEVSYVSLEKDKELLRSMLGIKLDKIINSSKQASVFQRCIKIGTDTKSDKKN